MVKRRRILQTGALTGIGALAGCIGDDPEDTDDVDGDPADAADATFKIGVPVGLTGPYATEAEGQLRGVELAVEQVNENPDYDFEFEILSHDTELDPSRAVEVTRRWIQEDDIDFIMGTSASSSGVQVAPLAGETETIFFSPNATDEIRGEVCNEYTFQLMVPSSQVGLSLGNFMYDNDEFGDEWYLVAADYEFGHDVATAFKNFADEHGIEIVGEEYTPFGHEDYSSIYTVVRDADPDSLIFCHFGDDSATATSQAISQGLHEEMEVVNALLLHTVARQIDQEHLQHTWGGYVYVPEFEEHDGYQDYVDAYRETYDETPVDLSATAFESAKIAAEAIHETDSTDTTEIADFLSGYQTDVLKERNIRECDHLGEGNYLILSGKAPDEQEHEDDLFDIVEVVDPDVGTPPCSDVCDM